jgi:hypothetical protein
MKYVILCILLFNFLNSVLADCGPSVDLNTMQPLQSIPMTDQDGTGLCYSYAAAQLVEFESKSKGYPRAVSAIDLAMKAGTGLVFDRGEVSSGHVSDAVKAAQTDGVASRACIEKKIKTFVGNSSMTSAQFTKLLEVVYDKFEWFWDSSEALDSLFGKLKKRKKSGDIGNQMDHLQGCDFDQAVMHLKDIDMLGASTTKVLRKIIGDCPSYKVPKFDMEEHFRRKSDTNDNKMEVHIDYQLTQKKPAVLHLCASSLVADNDTNFRQMGDSEMCGNHALLAVGKRENAGKCEYLLRNSWGSHWNPPGVKCAFKTPDGSYYPDNTAFNNVYQPASVADQSRLEEQFKKRVNVGCWFNSSQILSNTYGVGGIK